MRGAGRTDAGVHASGQVGHVDLSRDWRPDKLREALNAQMRPAKVAILLVEQAAEDFDARFSATARHYLYRIVNRRAPLTFDSGRAWLVKRKLDAEAMHAAAQCLVGRHDFSTFRDSECQAENPVRTLDRLDVVREGEEIHHPRQRARFSASPGALDGRLAGACRLRQMAGRRFAGRAEARDRARCGQVAPAAGLYLIGVDY